MLLLGRDGADNQFGFALRGGYGFTDRFDAEIGVALYDNASLLGVNGELWLLRATPGTSGLNFSGRGGFHLVQGDFADGTALDLSGLLSSRFTPNLELLGALDYTQNFYDNDYHQYLLEKYTR